MASVFTTDPIKLAAFEAALSTVTGSVDKMMTSLNLLGYSGTMESMVNEYLADPENSAVSLINMWNDSTVRPEAPVIATVSIAGPLFVNEGSITTVYTISVDQPISSVVNDIVVSLTYSGDALKDTDYTSVNSITIPAGSNNATFAINTAQDSLVEGNESYTITVGNITDTNYFAINPSVTSGTISTTIIDEVDIGINATVSIVGPSSVIAGGLATGYTITVDQAPVDVVSPITIDLIVTGTATVIDDYVSISSQTIAAGNNFTTFAVDTVTNVVAEGDETLIISLGAITDTNFESVTVSDTQHTVTTTLIDETAALNAIVSLTGPTTVIEGNTTTDYTVTINQDAATVISPITVNLGYVGSATMNVDYTAVSSVIIAAGTNSKTFTIATTTDAIAEGTESFTVSLGTLTDTNYTTVTAHTTAYSVTTSITEPAVVLDYYVDSSVGTSGDGSIGSPWKTIGDITGIVAGNAIAFKRGGTWSDLLYPVSGTSGNRVTYTAYGTGARPIIRGLDANNKSYFTCTEIYFTNSSYDHPVVLQYGTHHADIIDCDAVADTANSTWAALYLQFNVSYCRIVRCNAEHLNLGRQADVLNARRNSNHNIIRECTLGDSTHYSLSLEGADATNPSYVCSYNIIQDNVINNTTGAPSGMQSQSHNNVYERNTVSGGGSYDSWPRTVKNVSKHNIVRNNVFKDNPMTGTGSGIAVEVYKYSSDPTNEAVGNRFYNNVVTNIRRYPVVLATNGDAGAYAEDNMFKNNIIYENDPSNNYPVTVQDHSAIRDTYFHSNIIYESAASKVISADSTTYTVAEAEDGNFWKDNQQTAPDLDSNYAPNSGSPAIDNGAFLTTITSASSTASSFTVVDAKYFCDGFGIVGGDEIMLEGVVQGDPIVITDVDIVTNSITVNSSVTFTQGQGISLVYAGTAPNIGVSITSTGSGPEPVSSDFIEAESAVLTLPMAINSNAGASNGQYVSSPTFGSGTAGFTFTIASTGNYKITANIFAIDDTTDSFFVTVDGGTEFIWDLNPTETPLEYGVWREDDVTNRGTGTFSAPEFDPYTVNLAAGTHTIIIRTRENNTWLDYIKLVAV